MLKIKFESHNVSAPTSQDEFWQGKGISLCLPSVVEWPLGVDFCILCYSEIHDPKVLRQIS